MLQGIEQGRIKRLLKHRTTSQYYAGTGRWTPNVSEAMDFKSIWDVLNEAQLYGIRNCCEIILKFNGEEFDIQLPL